MNRKTIRVIVTVLLAAVFAVSVGMMTVQEIQHRKTVADADEAARLAGLHTAPETRRPEAGPQAGDPPGETALPAGDTPPEETAAPSAVTADGEPLPEEAAGLAGLDLEALRAYNEDVVGWLAIPGTEVSYPLLQGTDNQYYLHRSWKRESAASGSVFLESTSGRDLTDFHTIVYGHRMRDGTMFSGLRNYNYNGTNYWREHPSVYIVLDDTIYRYDIFSAQEAPVNGIVYRLDLEENHLEEEFLRYCVDRSMIRTGLVPEAGDRVLTLSTCTGDLKEEYRWVVHGVLAREYIRIKN